MKDIPEDFNGIDFITENWIHLTEDVELTDIDDDRFSAFNLKNKLPVFKNSYSGKTFSEATREIESIKKENERIKEHIEKDGIFSIALSSIPEGYIEHSCGRYLYRDVRYVKHICSICSKRYPECNANDIVFGFDWDNIVECEGFDHV